jgi:hypothetical protein
VNDNLNLSSGEKQHFLTDPNQTGPIKVSTDTVATNSEIQNIRQGENNVFTIHDKYRKYKGMVNSGYIRGLTTAEAMEMLRWTENKLNKTLPINHGCGSCMLDLVVNFFRLENT